MRVAQCSNIADFRAMARRRLPSPIFHYIDGAADDEVTCRRNTEAYESCDLVPSVLAGVETIDMSTTVMGQRLAMPLFCSPTALQRLFHHDGERAVAKAAEKFGTMFGVSSLGTVSVEEIGAAIATPKMFQLYFHKDRGLTNSMIERGLAANFECWRCLKGIMSVVDAKRAVDIGATGIMVSNHGGRQLDGSRSPFDQLAEIVDAVGDRIDVICDGGIRRGTHVLKALSLGAKACSGGRLYLFALAAAGQAGVERALGNLRGEIERDMKLMGCRSIKELSRENLRFR
jgi:isopentenyl diphosphate isomerase/L-lactate dehydrogenase-like FMN-dependent dehydrogenase